MHAPFEKIGIIEAIVRIVAIWVLCKWLWRFGRNAVKSVESDMHQRAIQKAKIKRDQMEAKCK